MNAKRGYLAESQRCLKSILDTPDEMPNNERIIQIILDLKNNLGKGLSAASGDLKGFATQSKATLGAIQDVGKIGAVAFAGLAFAAKDAIDLANQQIAVEARLNNVLESTGGVVGRTAKEIKDYASQLQATTTVGDEAIIQGQNMLLTFTSIREEAFDRTTKAALDLAVAFNGPIVSGQQMQTVANQLGKALNNPAEGLSKLTEQGVQFTDEQEAMVKALQESGDLMGAQSIILKELETQFGGAAAAAAGTFQGQMLQLSNTFGDLKEELGKTLIEGLTPFVTKLNESLSVVTEGAEKYGGLVEFIKILIAEFTLANPILAATISSFLKISVAVVAISTAISGIMLILSPFVAIFNAMTSSINLGIRAFSLLRTASVAVIPVMKTLFALIVANPIVAIFAAIVVAVGALYLAWTNDIGGIKTKTIEVFGAIKEFFSGFIESTKAAWAAFTSFLSNAWKIFVDALIGVFGPVLNAIVEEVRVWVDLVVGLFSGFFDIVRGIFTGDLDLIKQGFVSIFTAIGEFVFDRFEKIKGFVSNGMQAIVSAVSGIGGKFKEAFSNLFSGISGIASAAFDKVVGVIEPFVNRITGLINKIIDAARVAGSAIPGIGNIGGAFALGGDVSSGIPILVGEDGPEIFVPNRNGTIVSNPGTAGGNFGEFSQSGGNTINVSINISSGGGVSESIEVAKENLIRALRGVIKENSLVF